MLIIPVPIVRTDSHIIQKYLMVRLERIPAMRAGTIATFIYFQCTLFKNSNYFNNNK